jgi:uncharacterized protein
MIANTASLDLVEYIETNILPKYASFDKAHGVSHVVRVIKRSIELVRTTGAEINMVYTIAAYHDIGHHIDADNHEKVSSEMLLADSKLREFFSEEKIKTMSEAVYDHRASMKSDPRSIYGKIVSSADRNVLIEVPLKRTYAYRVSHNEDYLLSQIIKESREHLIKKFGEKGYATEKMYFEDPEYNEFLAEIAELVDNEEVFVMKYKKANTNKF